MEKQFELLKITRNNILKEIENCSSDQLFEIPKGYNNHILWNAVHVIASQQLLLYGLSQNPFRIDKSIVANYRSGTTPSTEVDLEMIDFAKNNLIPTVLKAEEDYQNKIFGSYKAVTTSYGVPINNVDDAINFINLHESMHYGQIKMLKKLVS